MHSCRAVPLGHQATWQGRALPCEFVCLGQGESTLSVGDVGRMALRKPRSHFPIEL